MKTRAHTFASGWLAASCALAPAAPAAGPSPQDPPPAVPEEPPQDPPEEPRSTAAPVLVTARKWGRESVADVPRSVTPVSAGQLRDAGATSIEEAARFVPNMFVTGFSARRLSFPFVRGVGSGQGDPAVATFVDDVPQLGLGNTNLSLTGLSRVEFLRGPSSALWGRNTIGGAINMVTRLPEFKPGVDASATLGNYDSQRYDVHATGPIVDDVLAMSFSGSYEKRDGFTTNTVTNRDVDSRDSAFGRAQVLWAPDERSIVRFILHGEETRDGGFALSNLDDQPGQPGLRNNPYRISQDFDGVTERDIVAGSVLWTRRGDAVDFVSITSAQGWDIDESADFDFSALDGVRRFTNEEQEYVYQEFRLESAEDAAGPRWLAGVSGFVSDSDRAASNEFRPGGAGILFPLTSVGTDTSTGDFDDHAVSVFGQVSVPFGERWEASAALRYDYESTDATINRVFTSGGFAVPLASTMQERSFERILPRASLACEIVDDVNVYGLAARGFRAGGFNLTAPMGSESFGTETSWTYEVGVKSAWCDDRLTASTAVFWVEWEDMQLSQFDPMAGGYVTNAGESTSRGIEVELAGRVCDCVDLFGTAGWLDTEFDSFTDQFGQNVAGNDLPFAPEVTAGLGGQYTLEVSDDFRAFARADWFHVGDFYYDAGNRGRESFDIVNFRIGGGGDCWRLDGFLHNAFDEDYIPIAFQPNPADPTAFVGSNGAPRTWGVSMRVTF